MKYKIWKDRESGLWILKLPPYGRFSGGILLDNSFKQCVINMNYDIRDMRKLDIK